MNSKNVLIVVDVYSPEISSTSHLMQELAEGLVKLGHKVTVVTAYPKTYLVDSLRGKDFQQIEVLNGVRVIRAKTLPLRKVNFIIRGISQLFLPILFYYQVRKNIREKIDVVINYCPPLPQAIVGQLVKKSYGSKFILNLQDIFPQNAIDLGILKNKLIIKFYEFLEAKVYQWADLITFNSKKGREFLIKNKNINPEKIIFLPNWVDVDGFDNDKLIDYRKEYGLDGKLVFLFGGIIGPAQGLDFLSEVARRVADLDDIRFLIVGDGTEKEKLVSKIKEYGLSNIILKDFIEKKYYPSLVSSFDVGIVALNSKNKTPFLPGKFLGYMAAGKPIFAFLNKESDGFELIEGARCGYAVLAGDVEAAEKAIRKFYEERNNLKEKAGNSFSYAKNNLDTKVILRKIEGLF